MAVTVVASAAANLSTNDPSSGAIGSWTPSENDVVVLFISSATVLDVVANSSLPSGWVNPLGDGTDVNSDSHGVGVLYHKVTSAEAGLGTTTYTATDSLAASETGHVLAVVLRGVDPTTPVDLANTAFDSGNTVTPHVLPSLSGASLSTDSLVLSFVAKDGTGTYTDPATHTRITSANTNQGVWVGRHNTLTTAGTNVAATNITPNAGDEYCSISLAFTENAAVTGPKAKTFGDSTTAASANTASINFTAGRLYLLAVGGRRSSAAWAAPTITGTGAGSWSEVRTRTQTGDTNQGITVFSWVPGATTSGTVTITIAGGDTAVFGWAIDEDDSVDSSGTIVQSADNSVDAGASGPLTVTLSAFGSASNHAYGAFTDDGGTGRAVGTGFTQLGNTITNRDLFTEAKTSSDTSVDFNWTSTDTRVTGIAIEVKAPTGGGSSVALDGTGAAANTGVAGLTITASITGRGDAATAGTAGISLAADLTGTGAAATAGTAGLNLAADLTATGAVANTGTADVRLAVGLDGSGAVSTAGTADVTVTAQGGQAVSLDGTGAISSAGSAELVITLDLDGRAANASGTTGALQAAVSLDGHGDTATAATGAQTLSVALEGYGGTSTGATGDLRVTLAFSGSGANATGGSATLFGTEAPVLEEEPGTGSRRPPPLRFVTNRGYTRIVLVIHCEYELAWVGRSEAQVTCSRRQEVEHRGTARVRCLSRRRADVTHGERSRVSAKSEYRCRAMSLEERLMHDAEFLALAVRYLK